MASSLRKKERYQFEFRNLKIFPFCKMAGFFLKSSGYQLNTHNDCSSAWFIDTFYIR